jgi:hypothetical protein
VAAEEGGAAEGDGAGGLARGRARAGLGGRHRGGAGVGGWWGGVGMGGAREGDKARWRRGVLFRVWAAPFFRFHTSLPSRFCLDFEKIPADVSACFCTNLL